MKWQNHRIVKSDVLILHLFGTGVTRWSKITPLVRKQVFALQCCRERWYCGRCADRSAKNPQ